MATSLLKNSFHTAFACVSRNSLQHCQVWNKHSAISLFKSSFSTKNFVCQQTFPNATNQNLRWRTLSTIHNSNFLCSQPVLVQVIEKTRSFSSNSPEKQGEEEDDLRTILKDKSLSITEKFKIIFKQYGLVMVAVHLFTSAIWVFIFYQAINRGIDITPFLERSGIFDYMEKWGISFVDKVRSSGASDYVVTYVVYELAKPIRYLVTLFGTMYSVRYLRRKGFIKRPPKSATMSELVQTQGKIYRHRIRKRTQQVKDHYQNRKKEKINGKRPSSNALLNGDLSVKTTNTKYPIGRRHKHAEDSTKKSITTEPSANENPAKSTAGGVTNKTERTNYSKTGKE